MGKELLKNRCQCLTVRAPGRRASAQRRKNRTFRPVLECLEGRTLPSITLSSTSWTPIGPAPGMSGSFKFVGRIDVAAPDPGNNDVMYVGANNGGIWKTTDWSDATPVWTELTDKPQILSQAVHEHDLQVFPRNSNIILGAASGPGGGVLRSDDGGNTWSFTANSHFDLAEFGALVVDPNVANAQTLYVAISGGSTDFNMGSGLYKSTDGGATWFDPVKFVHGFSGFSGFVSDLLQIQENGQTVLYAADPGNGQSGSGGIYRSDDGGVNWTATNLPANANGFESIRLAGSTTPMEQVYASIIDNSSSKVISRFSTADMGGTWTELTWPDAPGADAPNPPATSHRDHHNLLAVDPAHSNIVYVNVDLEHNLTDNMGEQVWRSEDSGQTWKFGGGAGDPVSGTFDSQGAFVAIGDNGVYRRNPMTLNLDQKGGNLNTFAEYSFSLDPNNTRSAYALSQDAPGTEKYVGNLAWQYTQPNPGQGEAGKIRVDPTNPNRVYYLDPNTADPLPGSAAARFVHSDDGGSTWQPAITGLPTHMEGSNTITNYAFYGKNALVMDPNNPQRLLLGLGSVFETQTGGDPNADPLFGGKGWRDIGANMGNGGQTITAIAISPSDTNTVYAGTYDGRVFKTTDAQDANPSWTEVDSGLPSQNKMQNQLVMDLVVSPTNPDYVYAVTSAWVGRDDKAPNLSGFDHVWTRNGGGWSQINGNLPMELGGETIAVDWSPATPKLYLGTLRGVFGSTDLGSTWTRFDSLPRTRVTDLDFVPSLNLIGAGTLGWGAWEILTKSTPPVVTPPADQKSVEGASQSFDLGSFTDPDGGPWTVDVSWGDGTADTVFTATSPGTIASKNHTYSEEGPHTVTITVTDTLDDQSDAKTFNVTISDPAVDATGGLTFNTVRGACLPATTTVASFTDPGGAEPNSFDPVTPLSLHYTATISWGDNTPGEAVAISYTGTAGDDSETNPFTVSAGPHIYTASGTYTITVTIHHEATTPQVVTDTVVVMSVLNHAQGCCDPNSLLIGAALSGSTIRVVPQGKQTGALTDTVQVLIDGANQGTFTGFNRITIYGQSGNDDLEIADAVLKDACIFGGGGNDRIKGGGGNNILIGGPGDDLIIGGDQNDLIIGGGGNDRLVGGHGSDVLIGGYTDFDNPCIPANTAALCAALDAWDASGTYAARVAAVEALLTGHVHAGTGSAKMTGSSGLDLFYLSTDDQITGKKKDEMVVAIV
jgi:Ca2+-binding RTX toxin-like protein